MSTMKTLAIPLGTLLLLLDVCSAFLASNSRTIFSKTPPTIHHTVLAAAALGEYTVGLTKPLGIILEERGEEQLGVQVASLSDGGAAAASEAITPGDVLTQINGQDVSSKDFDSVMDMLIEAPDQVELTWNDGLGAMDIAPNLVKQFKSTEEAVLADRVVRAAVKTIRRTENTQLGDLLKVEIILGAGVREDGRCLVRFFALFSTDGVTSYSCNVSATGRLLDDASGGDVELLALSCAKDEGWGQTVDLIVDQS